MTEESRSIIGKYLHCDFCGLNGVPSIDMNIINHVPQKQIDYNPELEVNEKCEQCSDNQSIIRFCCVVSERA